LLLDCELQPDPRIAISSVRLPGLMPLAIRSAAAVYRFDGESTKPPVAALKAAVVVSVVWQSRDAPWAVAGGVPAGSWFRTLKTAV
jgi:hypothetical protein